MTHEEVVAAYNRNNKNQTATSRELGIARSVVQYHLARAAKGGLTEAPVSGTPTGFNVERVTQHWHKGELTDEWPRFRPDAAGYEATIAAIEESMKKYEGIIPNVPHVILPPSTIYPSEDLATFYPIIDHHLGLYAWEPETGANYDLSIATKILRDSLSELVASAPNSDQAVILNIGDFFHSDNNRNRTERSNNILDADGR